MSNEFDKAWALFINKDNEGAKQVLYNAAQHTIDNQFKTKCLDLLCKICLMTQDNKVLKECLLMSSDSRLDYFRMSVDFYEGNSEKAWDVLQGLGRHDRKVHGFYGVGLESLVKDRDWANNLKINEIEKDLVVNIRSNKEKKYVILFSADSNYFKRFYKYSLYNIDTNPDAIFHYHIVNPDSEVIDIVNSYDNEVVNFSFEYVGDESLTKAYYASSRFLIAPKIMTIYQKPFFIFDIDSKLVGNLDNLFETGRWSREKLSLRVSPALELPWQKIVANAIYVPFNECGRTFLDRVARYLSLSFSLNRDRQLWWIDQNAMFFAYESFERIEYQRWTGLINDYIMYPKFLEDKDKSMMNM
ncbi:hypothetical protein [Aeromonas veronii]|uniref:hypothetical protein n=1 Tax=Aeromonas veronii TaxID=654 RepID=UPI003D1D2EB8